MPTPTEPIQYDELPSKYDARLAQRAMEANLRRVSEVATQPRGEAAESKPATASTLAERALANVVRTSFGRKGT